MEPTLTPDDRAVIQEIFEKEVVPKLAKLHARRGTLNCDFAGEKYRNWSLEFRSAGAGFDIVDFEYDEQGSGIDLDL